jgi:hypothetical protein
MPPNHTEIIQDIERHIRKFGGEPSEWCVGTAKDARAPFLRRHLAADLGDGLIYLEAFATTNMKAVGSAHQERAVLWVQQHHPLQGARLRPQARPGGRTRFGSAPGRRLFGPTQRPRARQDSVRLPSNTA